MKSFFILSFLFSSLIGRAQTIVSNDLFRIVYLAVDNPISLTNLKVSETNLKVKCDVGSIKKMGNGRYHWKICHSDKKVAFLKVYNKTKLIDSVAFKIISLPTPTLSTCFQDNEIILKNCPGIRADIIGFYIEGINCKIEKFTITI